MAFDRSSRHWIEAERKGYSVHHDMLGWFIVEPGEYDPPNGISIGFDGRPHYREIKDAWKAALAKLTTPCLALLMLFSLAALNGCVAVDEGLIILSDIIDRSDAAHKKELINVQP